MKNEIVRKNIAAELEKLSMSKAEICEALQISQRTLNRYLEGGSMPTRTLINLRFLTGKPVDYLLEE